MDKGVHIVLWVFVILALLLVVTHAQGFSTAVNAVGGQVTPNLALLSGGSVSTAKSGAVTYAAPTGGQQAA